MPSKPKARHKYSENSRWINWRRTRACVLIVFLMGEIYAVADVVLTIWGCWGIYNEILGYGEPRTKTVPNPSDSIGVKLTKIEGHVLGENPAVPDTVVTSATAVFTISASGLPHGTRPALLVQEGGFSEEHDACKAVGGGEFSCHVTLRRPYEPARLLMVSALHPSGRLDRPVFVRLRIPKWRVTAIQANPTLAPAHALPYAGIKVIGTSHGYLPQEGLRFMLSKLDEGGHTQAKSTGLRGSADGWWVPFLDTAWSIDLPIDEEGAYLIRAILSEPKGRFREEHADLVGELWAKGLIPKITVAGGK